MMTDIITKRAITYSVLAHIKNSGRLLAEGPPDVFIPNAIQRKSVELQEKDKETVRLKKENIEKENSIRSEKRDFFIANELKKWRRKSWICLSIFGLLLTGGITWIVIICNENLSETDRFINNLLQSKIIAIISSIIFFVIESIVVKSLYDKHQNHSNIKAYKGSSDIPDELKPVNK